MVKKTKPRPISDPDNLGMSIADFMGAHHLATMTMIQCVVIALDEIEAIELDDFQRYLTDVAKVLGQNEPKGRQQTKRLKLARELMGDLVRLLDRKPVN